MGVKRRPFLSYVLLAIYGGISVLGDGLHLLTHEAGHHHGLGVVSCETHGHAGADHCCHDPDCSASNDADYCLPSAERITTSSDCATHSHVCEVCAFLSQVLSQPVEVAAQIEWQPLAVVAASRPLPIYTPTVLGPHAPRGPPLVLA